MTEIKITGSQHKRRPGQTAPACVPEDFEALRGMTKTQLAELGMQTWETRDDGTSLMLFPVEWYQHIPNGYVLESIMGTVEPFELGKTDDDTRSGVLAYGIRVSDG